MKKNQNGGNLFQTHVVYNLASQLKKGVKAIDAIESMIFLNKKLVFICTLKKSIVYLQPLSKEGGFELKKKRAWSVKKIIF